jgi:hypothetical protein
VVLAVLECFVAASKAIAAKVCVGKIINNVIPKTMLDVIFTKSR